MYAGFIYLELVPAMLVMLECCEVPRGHHKAVFEKYSGKRLNASAKIVADALHNGFRLPAPLPLNHPNRLNGRDNF